MSCPDVLENNDPCKYHPKENEDGSPYSVKLPLTCPVQGRAFKKLLEGMAGRPQEYVTPNGKVTTNSVEGFHGLALKYRSKRIDLKHAHYCCKTNMVICHKNLGPLWKLITLCEMGVDIPAEAVEFMLKEQETWKKLREKRNKADYLHYRSRLKLKASERHASEKEHMVTLNAVGYATGEYTGSTVEESDKDDEEEEGVSSTTQDEGEQSEKEIDDELNNSVLVAETSPQDELPQLIFYDCKSTGGNIHSDHIIEVCGKVFAVSDAVAISKPEYSSLIHSSRTIMTVVEKKCGITSQMLFGAPRFGHVLEELLDWISTTVKEVEEYHNIPHYPVLVAHNGFAFDFRILFAELHRRKIPINRLKSIKLHFADTYFDCKREVKSDNPLFSGWTAVEKRSLEISSLFTKYFFDESYNAHRALGDVDAMVKLFTKTPLASLLSSMTIRNVQQMSNVWYENMQVYNRVQKLVLQFKQDTTKRMAERLDELGLTYTYIKEQYEALTCEEFGQWLHSIGISRKKWVCKITDHLRKLSKPAKSTSNK